MKAKETDPPWLHIALRELGVTEKKGKVHDERVLEYQKSTTLKATDDETPWCAAFVSWCLEQAGVESARSSVARAYLSWGKEIKEPHKGCICVFRRESGPSWGGHVAFFIAENEHEVFILGGNQNDQVNIQARSKDLLLGYRTV